MTLSYVYGPKGPQTRKESKKLIVAIITNLTPERKFLNFLLFSRTWDQKGKNLFLAFLLFFSTIWYQKWMNLLLNCFTIFYNLRPEIAARKLSAVNLYTVTEIIRIRSFKLRTGIEHKTLCFWRDKLEGSWGLLNKMTSHPSDQTSDLRRLKQWLLQVGFQENPWFNTCLQLAHYIIIIPRESISILI